jgi:mxaJ protein
VRNAEVLRNGRGGASLPLSNGGRWSDEVTKGVTASVVVLVAALGAACGPRTDQASPPVRELRVCSDPNNLPFSNEREEGFENRLADLVAAEMGATVRYTWWAQRRGFIRNTLRAHDCDVVMGVPTSYELVLATQPYYRSSYVFLYRTDRGISVRTFDDDLLRTVKVGVHVIGDDYANPPPAHALSSRGVVSNVVGYSIFGDYSQPNPPARLVDAVVNGDVDVAAIWGPFAGYFAKRHAVKLEIVPVSPEIDLPFLPFVFDISMGVRRDDVALKEELDAILERKAEAIDALLAEYGVPRHDAHHDLEAAAGP